MSSFSHPSVVSSRLLLVPLLAALGLSGCGGSDLPGGQSGVVGEELINPATNMPFLVDENQSGGATDFQIAEIFWGRLVNVHQLVADYDPMVPGDQQAVDPNPVFVDWVIHEGIVTNNVNFILETNAITKSTRLIILASKDSSNESEVARFRQLLDLTQQNFPFVLPKNDDGSSPAPFSFIARNACMVIRFNDCLDDSPDVVNTIKDRVRVLTGLPPVSPFDTRMIFDPNHGAMVGGAFHSTRILVDSTVSLAEVAQGGGTPNAVGFPASLENSGQPSLSLHIPTRIDFSAGVFALLTNVRGAALNFDTNGPRDLDSSSRDIVRALRAGNLTDVHNGFLRDEDPPSLLGAFALNMDAVFNDPGGTMDVDFIANITYTSPCEATPAVGDLVQVNGVVLEVTQPAAAPVGGSVLNVSMRASVPVPSGVSLLGTAEYLTEYDPAKVAGGTVAGCWVGFTPAAGVPPLTNVAPGAQVVFRFSEAMDPDSLSSFGGFNVVQGAAPANEDPAPGDALVVGPVLPSPGFDRFNFDSTLPMNHALGVSETFHVRLRGATDLAGNALDFQLPFVDFMLDPTADQLTTGGVSMRFDATDELGAAGPDVRGQVLYQIDARGGRLIPRQPLFGSYVADRSQPVPALQVANPLGVTDPLTPRGSKLQFVWRYCDFDLRATDETKYDLDIVGMSWAPLAGAVQVDNYEAFEMRLAHSRFLPDDSVAATNPNALITGLQGAPSPFTSNILEDPQSPQMVVHPSSLGYRIDPTELFVTPSGTTMMPFPYDPFSNVGIGGVPDTFTWRDTSVQALGGMNEPGIPMSIETAAGINYPDPDMPGMTLAVGALVPGGAIPSWGLPLLVEVRCFPSNEGIGLNTLDVSLAAFLGLNLSGIQPGTAMRAYSSGGIDNTGQLVNKNPNDQSELVPSGGFNPFSVPPNQPSLFTADNQWYLGQIDTVIRVSRAHSIWLSAGGPADFVNPILTPDPDTLPSRTDVVLEYRGAALLTNSTQLDNAQNASNLDAYGDIDANLAQVMFLNGDNTWKSLISQIDGAGMFQVRFTFVNNIETGQSPRLDAVGFAYSR